MARTDQDDVVFVPPLGPGGPAPGAPRAGRVPRRRLSTGHLVMIVAAIVAALLTYSVLRQAGGQGTEVLVAAAGVSPGQTATGGMFTTATIKAGSGVTSSTLETPAHESALLGQVANVGIGKGQLIAPEDFSAVAPQPSRAAIVLDPVDIPGGAASIKVGSTIDVIGVTAQGAPITVPGLQVLKAPAVPAGSGSLSGGTSSVQISVAVPNLTLMDELFGVTQGKFAIRVTDPGAASGPSQPGGAS
ncbi:MAG: hypothetical protein ACRDJU_14240 [Actinomycetota bacterium]